MIADRNDLAAQYDVIVIGGGPAGCAAATIVRQAGYGVLLVEREKMPRPHVGESLMPESYWIFERLGVLDKLEASRFPRKVGVQFVSNTGRESQPFFFREHDPRPSSETWHVDRGQFDQMLFTNAAQHGVDCRDGVRVTDVTFDEGRATGVVVTREASSAPTVIRSQVVIDATGQQSFLANKFGLKRINPDLRKAAIWGHFRGGERDVDGGGVKTIILHTQSKQAWFWYIPQADDVVSVGVVGDNDYLLKGRGRPEEVFAAEVANCPGIRQRLAEAQPVDKLMVAKEFSYTSDQAAGDGWVLVGDAWGFIDPIYSSGVYFALKSAELAADCVVDALAHSDPSAARLGRWTSEFVSATSWIRKLVHAFYSGEFRVGKFIMQHPEHRGRLTDLLIGRIFGDDVGKLFDDLDPWLEGMAAGTKQ